MRQIYLAVLFLFAATTAFCQNPLLLKDVYPGATGSSIQQIVKTSNYTFFNAEDDDADTDRGLYRTDGTTGGTIRLNLSYLPDPPPSANNYASTKADKLTALGDKVIFAGDNFAPGYGEIWASDGTQAGTIALERFQPTVANRGPVYELAAMNGYVYYGVIAGNNKTQIRRTDGTAAGTSLVYEFSSYTTAPEPGLFKVINGILYFNIYDRRGAGNDMVWRTDGTTAGTYQLRDMGADYFLMGFFMEPVNGATCFMTGKVDPVNFASSKTTLFKTDGTPAGTVPVYDFNGVYNNNLYPSYAVIGNTVYFSAYDNVNGKELWKTDGTTAGTMLVADIVPGAGSSSPLNLKNFNGQLYFSANISGTYKFYKLEGNTAVMIKDIAPLNGINGNSSFAISNNSLVFTAASVTSGAELWISDGTTANTFEAADINPGVNGSSPMLITSGNPVYFSANNGVNGTEIFRYDNTAGIAGLHKIYVNDNSTTGDVFTTAVGSNANAGTKTSPVASINYALSIAQAGDTIMVDAGLYAEQILVNKGITIFGAGVALTKITRPAVNLAAAPGSPRCGVINTVAGIGNFVLKNLTIESAGTATSTNGGFCVVSQTGGEISGCELKGGYLGDGVHFSNSGLNPINIAVLNNNFSNIFFFGVNIQGTLISAAVNNNSIDVTGSPYGMGILGGGEPAFLDAFSASGNLVKGFNGFGIKYACNNAGTLINNNYFEHSLTLSPGGSQAPYIQNTGSIQGDASCNWYGTADAELIKTKIVGNINYGPWLVSGTDLAPAQNGFQPAAGTCTGRQNKFFVNDNSQAADVFTTAVGNNANSGLSSAPFASINYAISVVQPGDTIIVDAGTFTEQVTIDKSISIKGAGSDLTSILKPAITVAPPGPFTEQGVIQTAQDIGDVHIKDLSVTSVNGTNVTPIIIQGGGSVKNCKLQNGNQGIFFRVASATGTAVVENNIISAEYIGVNFAGAALTASLANNNIQVTNTGFSACVFAGADFGGMPGFTATGNTVSGYAFAGFFVNSLNANINQNSITGLNGPAIQQAGGNAINATCNWFGTADAELIKPKMNGNINYTPWLTNGTDNDGATGFQPEPGACNGRQNKFYVNDNSQAGDVFTTAVGNNTNNGFSSAPFATINYAISVAQPGDSIIVDAGTYAERVYINKSLHLKGAYAGTSPGNSLNRGSSETILLPAIENNTVEIVTVAASNVSFDGFLLDGDNPDITGSITLNGVDVNAGMGIYNLNLQTDNAVIKNNIFKNFYRYGILLQKTASPVLTGAVVTRNRFDNISRRAGADGRGVAFFSNVYGSISENVITRVSTGVIIANYTLGSTASLDISSNNIETYTTGINLAAVSNFTSAVTVSDNQVSNADLSTWSAPGSTTVNSITGINMGGFSSTGTIAFNNNTVAGTSNGFFISSAASPHGISINGGTVSNALQVGVFYIGNTVNPSKLNLGNVSLINNVVGLDASSTSNDSMRLEFSGVIINGGTTGIRFYGKNISLPGNALTGVSFLNQSKQYILQTVHSFEGQSIDASSVSFDGLLPTNMTLAQLFATEDKLTHKIDFDSVGYFKLKPTEVYITTHSFAADLPPVFGTPTTAASIKRAFEAAAAGDIINIAAGTYTEQLTIDKAITLKGEGAGQTIIARGATGVLTRLPGFSEAGIIQSSVVPGDIIIRDLTVDGSNGTSPDSGPHHAIMLQAGGAIRDCEIKNMQILGTGSQEGNGIYVSYNGPSPKTMEISNNNLHDFTWVGMNVQGNNLTAAITNNNINAAGAIYGMPMAIGGWGSTLTGLTLTNNAISNYNGFGLSVGSNNALINYNSFTAVNNAPAIINNGPLVNATCNWYGVTAAHDVATKVSVSTVNYTPWLSNGTDNDVATGFQPVAGSCNGTPVVAVVTTAINVNCHGANNGSIDVTISGGVAPYSFAWSKDDVAGFSGLEDLSSLAPGEYQLIVTDANGSADTVATTITEPDLLAATATGTNNICHGGSTGTADLSVTGGTLPYTYLWSNGETTESLTGIAAGIYSVTVTDANGCTAMASYEVTQPTLLTAGVTGNSTSCSNAATVTAAGGTGAYSYLWSNGATTTAIASVPAGTYSVTVTDANGCTAVAEVTLTANEAFNPSAQVNNVTCYGLANGSITVTNVNAVAPFTYSIDGLNFQATSTFNNLAAGSYTITVTDANGCTGFVTKTVAQPTELTAMLNTVQPTCFGSNTGAITVTAAGGTGAISYAWTGPDGYSSAQRNISNLAAGTYVLTVTDNNGCTAPLTAVVAGYDNIIVAATVNNIGCKGEINGSIQLDVKGGTGSGFSYGWSNGAVTKDISNLGVANYTVTITDIGSGCVITRAYSITQPATAVNLSATKTNAAGCGAALGTITATGTGGTGPYTYKLNTGNYQASGSFAGLYAGSYTVWVKDANGCTKSVVLSITDNGSDQYESNNSKNQAALVSMNTAVNARLAISTDIADWFKFTTPAGSGSYTVSLSHPSANYTFNVYATGNNTPALVPVTSSAGAKTYTLAGSATYYVSITGGARSYNCYELFVGPTPAPGLITTFAAGKDGQATDPVTPEVQQLEAAVYPNPHNGEFNLLIKSAVKGNAVIELFGVNGQKILTRTVAVNAGTTTTRFSGIQESLLMYKIAIGNRFASGKIIRAK